MLSIIQLYLNSRDGYRPIQTLHSNTGRPGSRAFVEGSEVRRRWPAPYMDYLESKLSFDGLGQTA